MASEKTRDAAGGSPHDSADAIAGLYERHAHSWDSTRLPDLQVERQWIRRLASLLEPGATVLDLGCGSGQPIARYLVSQGFRVTGVDSSPTLIGICRERFPDQEWIVADMRGLSLGRSFGGIVAWDSLFHLSPQDQRGTFPILAAHARAGAPLIFTSGPAAGEAIGEWHGEPLYHASLAPEEYRDLLQANGFQLVTCRLEDPGAGHHSVWIARRR